MNNFERIKAMDIGELAEYIRQEQEDTIDAGRPCPLDNIIAYLAMEVE